MKVSEILQSMPLITELRKGAPDLTIFDDEYWEEVYQERAAIMEFDGGFSRRDAEEAAGYWVDGQKRDWERRHGKTD